MLFCPNCENYLVMQILNSDVEDNSNKLLIYHCYNCGYQNKIDISQNLEAKCIYQSQKDLSKIKIYSQNLKYLKYDRTLPHVDNINCPNINCPTHNNSKDNSDNSSSLRNNVLYMNLNDNMLIYLYQCCHCDYTWTNK